MRKKIVRFEIQDLLPIGLTLVVAGIGLVYGLNVMGDIKSDMCVGTREHFYIGTCYVCPNSSHNHFLGGQTGGNICSNATTFASNTSSNVSASVGGGMEVNASGYAVRGVAKLPEKMPLIATVIVAAVIISILVRYLMVRFA